MSKDFALEDLKTYILDKENPVGFDEFFLLMAEYIGDKDIMNATDELISDLYKMLDDNIKEIIGG